MTPISDGGPAAGPPKEPEEAPDFFRALWARTRQRRTVRWVITYLPVGFALLQFLDFGTRNSAAADPIMQAAWLAYVLGLFLVVFAAPLVFTGTHYFRTGYVVAIVAISLVAGVLIRGQFLSDDRGGEDGSGRRAQGADSAVGTDEDPAAVAFQRVLALYGESDQMTLDTSTRGAALFEGFDAPIGVRLISMSGGRRRLDVEPTRDGRSREMMELPILRSDASSEVRVPSSCGELVYRVQAVRVREDEAEITVTIDRERSRAAVARALTLEQCRL